MARDARYAPTSVDNDTSINALTRRAQTQWFNRPADERFETLDSLEAHVRARKAATTTYIVAPEQLKVEQLAGSSVGLALNTGADVAVPTAWAFQQLAGLAKAPASYLRSLPAAITTQALNYGLSRRQAGEDQKELKSKVMIWGGETPTPEFRCVTGPEYGRIWDLEVVQMAQAAVKASGGKLYNPPDWNRKPSGLYASDRDVFILLISGGSLVDGGGERDQLHKGLMIWNSEVGAATFGLSAFLYRQVCGNHLLFGARQQVEVRLRHTSRAPERFVEAMPKVMQFIDADASAEERAVRAAKAKILPVAEDELNKLTSQWFTKRQTKLAVMTAQREEGRCENVWDLVQGFTANARDEDNSDVRTELERKAGSMMLAVTGVKILGKHEVVEI